MTIQFERGNKIVFYDFYIIPNDNKWKPITLEEAFKRRISFTQTDSKLRINVVRIFQPVYDKCTLKEKSKRNRFNIKERR